MNVTEFDALPGIAQSKETIVRLLAFGSAVQSVMISGASGSNSRELAQFLAKGWLCTAPVEGFPCEACAACRSEKSVDLQWVEPSGAGMQIRVSAIREVDGEDDIATIPITRFFRTRPLSARTKVVVIDQCHRLNPSASNALLKILEEPPPYARFILITDSPSEVRATIRSRCFQMTCGLPSDSEIEAAFGPLSASEEIFGKPEPRRLELIREAGDAYDALVSLFDRLMTLPPAGALRASEEFQECCSKLGDSRQGVLEGLSCLSLYLRARAPSMVESLQATVEAHRRIRQSGSISFQCDALFAGLLDESRAIGN